MYLRCLYVTLSLSVMPCSADDLSIINFHKSSIQAIRTISCDIMMQEDGAVKKRTVGHYWREGSNVRVKYNSDIDAGEILIANGRYTAIEKIKKSPVPMEDHVILSLDDGSPFCCDLMFYSLITFPEENGSRITLDKLVGKYQVNSPKQVVENKKNYSVVSLSNSIGEFEIWLDPSVNYLVCKVLSTNRESGSKSQLAVTNFKEVTQGVYFPEEMRCKQALKGQDVYREIYSIKFSAVQINKPMPDGIFKLKLPPGVLVSDMINGKMARTDASGNPTVQAVSKRGNPLKLDTSDSIFDTQQFPKGKATDVGGNWWWKSYVVIAASMLILLIVAIRRKRSYES